MRLPTRAASLRQHSWNSANLLQRVSYAIKRVLYIGAGELDGSDDRDRNSGSDETILDGGRARVVFQETQDKLIQLRSP